MSKRVNDDPDMPEFRTRPAGRDCAAIRDLLLLADVDVPEAVIKAWSPSHAEEAEEYAARVIQAATSLNGKMPKKPKFLASFKPPQAVQP